MKGWRHFGFFAFDWLLYKQIWGCNAAAINDKADNFIAADRMTEYTKGAIRVKIKLRFGDCAKPKPCCKGVENTILKV